MFVKVKTKVYEEYNISKMQNSFRNDLMQIYKYYQNKLTARHMFCLTRK